MKKLLLLIAVMIGYNCSFAQLSLPIKGTYGEYSQMWNTSSAYYFTPTFTNIGTQKDTVVNTGTLNLYSAQLKVSPTGNDSFYVNPVEGWGSITLTSAVYKCTGTPTVTVTPVSSSDGIIWAPIPGATAGTTLSVNVLPTSLTVPSVTKWTFTQKPDKYLGLLYAGSASSTVMCQGWYYLLKPYVFGN